MRIVSLLPGTTEIVCALGLESQLVGRSHECDFPASVRALPACTEPKYQAEGTSRQVDQRITTLIREGLSIYRVDASLLASLEPDIILTQDHCEVCAASYAEVRQAVQEQLSSSVEILSVSPTDLDEVFLAINQIGEALGVPEKGTALIKSMITRFNEIQSRTGQLPSPEVVSIEWIDPLMASGNWFPELVRIAGGTSLLGTAGEPSPWIDWSQLEEQDPDILLVSPCGYSLNKTAGEMITLTSHPGWSRLKAVQQNRVFLAEGHHYFHRPGPRLTDSAEILAEIFHPGIFDPGHHKSGWIKFTAKAGK
ncbi:cobalamin-binding protein [Halalkalibaculum sp. DA384]|uniref:cobalamin-binding protein n=1 Tax=Halalkalibaculum sp. DA384 TaxID=3373606 RepID=UPI003754D4E8